MSTGRIIQNNTGQKAEAPIQVYVSDGTHKYPYGHPDYFSSLKPDGMVLLDLKKNEYSEFRVDTDRDFTISLYQHMVGSRYKLFVYRSQDTPINIHFNGEAQVFTVKGTPDGQSFIVLNIEVAELAGKLINRIGATSEKLEELVSSLNSSAIKLSEDVTFNGVSQGSYNDGDTIQKDTILTEILKKFAQKTLPVTYSAPSMGLTPSSQSVEAGTNVAPNIAATFTQRDAGAINRYLLQLSTAGAANVNLVDAAILQAYAQANIQVQDGQHLSYTATIFYDEGITKVNNVGQEDPTGKILAGSLVKNLIYTGVRQAFYGMDTTNANPTTSAQIRALSGKKLNPANGTTFALNIPAGTKRVIIAYPDTLRDLSSVKYVELGNAEVADTFTKLAINVEGANGYQAIGYKVYVYIPDVAFNASATYNVTI
ncbi:hypothetical protein KDU71_02535 [Carboxylicivirga sediminis]|uniref:Uncharacterized protein n=1 Tax=Carboxylicivirga sediminis TaxID=2006564 RepID=A0A941F0Y1_9BACT|nr:hypothetical protein [Carboxylicivirga sediminis]MBR8534422.1 hypothetical protein [Carboxylicivirga sediminis]